MTVLVSGEWYHLVMGSGIFRPPYNTVLLCLKTFEVDRKCCMVTYCIDLIIIVFNNIQSMLSYACSPWIRRCGNCIA